MPYNSSYTGAEIDAAIATVKDTVTQGATTEVLVGGGVSTDPVFTTATGTGAPARAGSPTFTTKITTPIIDLTGGQIAFPGTQAPSAGANTLDDYEEGTFGTAAAGGILISATSGTLTCGAVYLCNYVKIGRLVSCTGLLTLSASDSPVGYTYISLPFAAEGGDAYNSAGSLIVNGLDFIGTSLHVYAAAGSVIGYIIETVDNTAWNIYLAQNLGADESFMFQITYTATD